MNIVEMTKPLLEKELAAVPFLSCIPKEELYALAEFSHLCSFDEGEVLIAEGTVNANFYILMSGTVNIIKKGKWNEKIQIVKLGGNATIGESALLKDELSTATVSAAEPATLLIISREQFTTYVNTYPKAGLVLMTYIVFSLLQKLRTTNEKLADERCIKFAQEDLDTMMKMFQSNNE